MQAGWGRRGKEIVIPSNVVTTDPGGATKLDTLEFAVRTVQAAGRQQVVQG